MSIVPERYLLVKSTAGSGLGDRIRSLAAAIQYARLSGRTLVVTWDDGLYGEQGRDVFPELFCLQDVPTGNLDLSAPLTTRPAIWQDRLHLPMKVLYQAHGPKTWSRSRTIELFSFDQSRLDHAEDVLVMWEFDQFGKSWELAARRDAVVAAETRQSTMRRLVKQHVHPSGRVAQQVAAFKRAHFTRPMIGVHVRASNEPGARIKQFNETDCHRLIRCILSVHPETGVFLATDNREVEERFRQRYQGVVTTAKWLPEPGEPLHLSAERQNRLRGAVEALTDLFLLAECDYLIHPRTSAFSQVAGMFSKAMPRHVFPLDRTRGLRARWSLEKRLFLMRMKKSGRVAA